MGFGSGARESWKAERQRQLGENRRTEPGRLFLDRLGEGFVNSAFNFGEKALDRYVLGGQERELAERAMLQKAMNDAQDARVAWLEMQRQNMANQQRNEEDRLGLDWQKQAASELDADFKREMFGRLGEVPRGTAFNLDSGELNRAFQPPSRGGGSSSGLTPAQKVGQMARELDYVRGEAARTRDALETFNALNRGSGKNTYGAQVRTLSEKLDDLLKDASTLSGAIGAMGDFPVLLRESSRGSGGKLHEEMDPRTIMSSESVRAREQAARSEEQAARSEKRAKLRAEIVGLPFDKSPTDRFVSTAIDAIEKIDSNESLTPDERKVYSIVSDAYQRKNRKVTTEESISRTPFGDTNTTKTRHAGYNN